MAIDSGRRSAKSTYSPLRILLTSLAGIGGDVELTVIDGAVAAVDGLVAAVGTDDQLRMPEGPVAPSERIGAVATVYGDGGVENRGMHGRED